MKRRIRMAVSAAVTIALAAVLLAQLPGPRPASRAARSDGEAEGAAPRAPWWSFGFGARAGGGAARAPWQSQPDDAPLPPGYVAAWRARPPAPDGDPPPRPVEPPDPQRVRPPLVNPGGVDGNLPQRPRTALLGFAP